MAGQARVAGPRESATPINSTRPLICLSPTRVSAGFALLLLVMLIGSINYGSNLGYLLTFLLAAIGLVSVLHTYRNLAGLRIGEGYAQAVFAGQVARFAVAVENRDQPARYALELALEGGEPVLIDVAAGEQRWVALGRPAPQRGRLPAATLTVLTRYPLGLAKARRTVTLRERCTVYPAPAGQPHVPPSDAGVDTRDSRDGSGGEGDIGALRPYRPGDALARMHWKSLARGLEPHTMEAFTAGTDELWLDWANLAPGLDVEQRLAGLCAAALAAEEAGQRYGLRLPGRVLAPGRGAAHRHRVLEALATYGLPA